MSKRHQNFGRPLCFRLRRCWDTLRFVALISIMSYRTAGAKNRRVCLIPCNVRDAPSCVQRSIDVCNTKHPTTVHDGLLHPHLRQCSSPASAVRRLPSAVRTATPAFDVRSSGLLRPSRRPGTRYLDLRDPSRSFNSFRRDVKTFLFSFY